ncbi:ShET2/EspL2 family type III secretion system effector toxin [Escherichia coli]|nr:ShET2/EspL2 family type III secretion system effector toxin [Escherichia coli]
MKLNGQCYFPGRPQNRIVCRHIAAQYINDIYQNVDYKPHQDDYSSAEKISHALQQKMQKPDFGVGFQPS